MEFIDIMLRDQNYNVRSGCEMTNYDYDVLTSEGMADAVPLCKWVTTLGPAAICLVQRYSLMDGARCCQEQ